MPRVPRVPRVRRVPRVPRDTLQCLVVKAITDLVAPRNMTW